MLIIVSINIFIWFKVWKVLVIDSIVMLGWDFWNARSPKAFTNKAVVFWKSFVNCTILVDGSG